MKNIFRDYDFHAESYLAVYIPGERLGVIFNSRLSFDAHINDKVSKANKILVLVRRTSTFLDEVTLAQLYKAFVRYRLEFSNCVWSPSLKNILR